MRIPLLLILPVRVAIVTMMISQYRKDNLKDGLDDRSFEHRASTTTHCAATASAKPAGKSDTALKSLPNLMETLFLVQLKIYLSIEMIMSGGSRLANSIRRVFLEFM